MKWLLVVVSIWNDGDETTRWSAWDSRSKCEDAIVRQGNDVAQPIEGQIGRGIAFCVRGQRWLVKR